MNKLILLGIFVMLLFTFGCLGPSQPNVNNTAGGNVSGVVSNTSEQSGSQAISISVFNAEPPVIEKGKSTVLRWTVEGADKVVLKGIGDVALQGSTVVVPEKTTTYTLIAVGSNENKTASVNVVVKEVTTETQGNDENNDNSSTTVDDTGSIQNGRTIAGICGNGECEEGENSTTCCYYCGCSEGYSCEEGTCVPIDEGVGDVDADQPYKDEGTVNTSGTSTWYNPGLRDKFVGTIKNGFCGDGVCMGDETTRNCCEDCGCDSAMDYCSNNTCKSRV